MKIIVNPHKLEIAKSPVNEKEINVTEFEFEFAGEITDNYVKEAYFTFKGNTYKQIIVNNKCDIPSEVLDEKGQVELGVVAYIVENGEELKRYNPSPAYFNTWVGSLKEEYENTEPITPTDLEQLQSVVAGKQNMLVSGTNIKTINNQSLLGSGNINIQGGSGGSNDYEDLDNKPSINNVELIGNKSLTDLGIDIPTTLAELTDDSTHRVVTDTEKATWYGKSDFSGSYTDLTDKPTIPTVPTNVSSFTNDSGYLVSGDLKTINGNSVVGSGNIVVGSDINYYEWNGEYTGNETTLQDVYDKIVSNEAVVVKTTSQMRFIIYTRVGNSGYAYSKPTFIGTTYGNSNTPVLIANVIRNTNDGNTNALEWGLIGVYFQVSGGTVTGVQPFSQINYNLPIQSMVDRYDSQVDFRFKHTLTTDNTVSYTPTADYNPATKKYVDDSIASAITTTLNGSY